MGCILFAYWVSFVCWVALCVIGYWVWFGCGWLVLVLGAFGFAGTRCCLVCANVVLVLIVCFCLVVV